MSSDVIEVFVAGARAYCELVKTAETLSVADRIATAHMRLLELYITGLSLPATAGGDIEAGPSEGPPQSWPGFGDKDRYWKVVGPYERSEPVVASISDDMVLIYRYIQRGLALWDGAHKMAAVAEWRRHFEVHWSDVAIDAIRALHWRGHEQPAFAQPIAGVLAPTRSIPSTPAAIVATPIAAAPVAAAAPVPAPPVVPPQAAHLDEAQLGTLRQSLSERGKQVNDGLIAVQAGRPMPAGAFPPSTIDPSAAIDVRLKEFLQLIHARMKMIRDGNPAYGLCLKCKLPIAYSDLQHEPWLQRHVGCWKRGETNDDE